MTEHKNREACQLEGYNVRYDPDFNRRYQSSKVENIKTLIPTLDQMVDEGLIAISDVEVIKYVHQDGVRSQG